MPTPSNSLIPESSVSKHGIKALCGKAMWIWSFEAAGRTIKSTPDWYGVAQGLGGFWVELKAVNTLASKIPFREGQPQWLLGHCRKGGKSLVLVYVRDLKRIILVDGCNAYTLSKNNLAKLNNKWVANVDFAEGIQASNPRWLEIQEAITAFLEPAARP